MSERTVAVRCVIRGCRDVHLSRRLCVRHYNRARHYKELHLFPAVRAGVPDGPLPAPGTTRTELGQAGRVNGALIGRPESSQVPAGQVADHIRMLEANGVPAGHIPVLSSQPAAEVRRIVGGAKRTQREVALAILAVRPTYDGLPDRTRVAAIGTRRRIQALIAHGWQMADIAGWLGIRPQQVSLFLRPDAVTVTARQHREVRAVFDGRAMLIPHQRSAISLRRAAEEVWVSALAWDDIDFDPAPPAGTAHDELDDDGFVDEIAVELALAGEHVRLTGPERRSVVARAHARDWSDQKIAQTTGISDQTVLRLRGELGLPAVDRDRMVGWEAA